LFVRVADGLALAHKASVVHRDLSPDNIILQNGEVGQPKIIDFGIARSATVGGGTLIGGNFAGKYNFVSPEQLGIKNRQVTVRSDIYSLGLVIAAALRGEALDMGGSHVDVIDKRRAVPDVSDVEPSLRPLVESMLQPDPDDRPESAQVAEWLRATAAKSIPPLPGVEPYGGSTAGPYAPATQIAGIQMPPSTPPSPLTASPSSGVWQPLPEAPASESHCPFSGSHPIPPTPASESPFGGYVPVRPGSLPPLAGSGPIPQAVEKPPPAARAKSGKAKYWVSSALLIVAAAFGGTYQAGFLGPPETTQRWGRIITSTSSGVVAPIVNLGISNSLRQALLGWSKTVAAEVGRDGVTANIVVPGRIATQRITYLDEQKAKREQRPLDDIVKQSTGSIPPGRYGDPQEYADVVAFLASERASYLAGSTFRADGGMLPNI